MLQVDNIHSYYGDSHVLQGVSVNVKKKARFPCCWDVTAWEKRRPSALLSVLPSKTRENPVSGKRDSEAALVPGGAVGNRIGSAGKRRVSQSYGKGKSDDRRPEQLQKRLDIRQDL